MAKKTAFATVLIGIILFGIIMFGLFKKNKTQQLYDVHLCPEVNGQVLDNGKAVAGLTIIRHLVYIDEKLREDKTVTQADGSFSFPEVNIQSPIPGNPFAEHNTDQVIFLEPEKEKYIRLWSVNMPSKEPKAEFIRKLSSLNCDLQNKEVGFEFKYDDHDKLTYYGSTICRWDNDFKIY